MSSGDFWFTMVMVQSAYWFGYWIGRNTRN